MRAMLYALGALAVCIWPLQAVEPPANLNDWAAAQGRNFIVYLEKRSLDPMPAVKELDAFWGALAADFETQPIPGERVPVYIFADRATYDEYLRLNGKSRTATGWCHVSDGSTCIATRCVDMKPHDRVWLTLRHEATHLYLATQVPNGKELPEWINEGLAAYYAHARVVDGKIADVTSERGDLYGIQGEIRVGSCEGLERHLARRREPWDGRKSIQSWSVTYWLMTSDGGVNHKALRAYVMGAGAEHDTAKYFEKVMGIKMAEAERKWKEYILGLKPEEKK